MAPPRKRIGELLAEAGAIDPMQLQAALGHQRQWGGKLGSVLVERGFIAEGKLVEVLAAQLGVPVVQISKSRVDPRALALVPAALCEQLRIFPLELKGSEKSETLVVAMSDPTDLAAVDQLQFRARKRIQAVLAGDRDIGSAIRRHYHNENAPPPPDPVTAAPRRAPDPEDEFYGDSHLLGSTVDDERVPGLMAWGEGEVKKRPNPAPPASGVPLAVRSPASVVPAGIPPGFVMPSRARSTAAPAGLGVSIRPSPGQPEAIVHPREIDPFNDLEPDIDPLRGVDPVQSRNTRAAPPSFELDALGGEADDWAMGIEPVAGPLGDNDPLGGSVDFFAEVEPAGQELEELDVDSDMQEITGEPNEPRIRSRTGRPPRTGPISQTEAVDAAAEGWLTPREDSGSPSSDAWTTPSEAAGSPADQWATMSEGESAAGPQAADSWNIQAAETAEAAPEAWGEADPDAAGIELAPDEAAAESDLVEEAWFEPGQHEAAEDTSGGVESWLEPIAATIGMGSVEPSTRQGPPVEDGSESSAPQSESLDWGDQSWPEQEVAPSRPWPSEAKVEPNAEAEGGWLAPEEFSAAPTEPASAEGVEETTAWDAPSGSADASWPAAEPSEESEEAARVSIDSSAHLLGDSEDLVSVETALPFETPEASAPAETESLWADGAGEEAAPPSLSGESPPEPNEALGETSGAEGAVAEEASAEDWASPAETPDAALSWSDGASSPSPEEAAEAATEAGAEASEFHSGTAGEEPAGLGSEWEVSHSAPEVGHSAATWAAAPVLAGDTTADAPTDWSTERTPLAAAAEDWSTVAEAGSEARGWADPEVADSATLDEAPSALVSNTDPSSADEWWISAASGSPPEESRLEELPPEELSSEEQPSEGLPSEEPAPEEMLSGESREASALDWASGVPSLELSAEPDSSSIVAEGAATAWALDSEQPGNPVDAEPADNADEAAPSPESPDSNSSEVPGETDSGDNPAGLEVGAPEALALDEKGLGDLATPSEAAIAAEDPAQESTPSLAPLESEAPQEEALASPNEPPSSETAAFEAPGESPSLLDVLAQNWDSPPVLDEPAPPAAVEQAWPTDQSPVDEQAGADPAEVTLPVLESADENAGADLPAEGPAWMTSPDAATIPGGTPLADAAREAVRLAPAEPPSIEDVPSIEPSSTEAVHVDAGSAELSGADSSAVETAAEEPPAVAAPLVEDVDVSGSADAAPVADRVESLEARRKETADAVEPERVVEAVEAAPAVEATQAAPVVEAIQAAPAVEAPPVMESPAVEEAVPSVAATPPGVAAFDGPTVSSSADWLSDPGLPHESRAWPPVEPVHSVEQPASDWVVPAASATQDVREPTPTIPPSVRLSPALLAAENVVGLHSAPDPESAAVAFVAGTALPVVQAAEPVEVESAPASGDASQSDVAAASDARDPTREQPLVAPPVKPAEPSAIEGLAVPPPVPTAANGWSLLGVAQPRAEDAVDVIGALVDLLVSRGTVSASELIEALNKVRQRPRE